MPMKNLPSILAIAACPLLFAGSVVATAASAQSAAPASAPAPAPAQQLVYFGTRVSGPDTGIVAARFDPTNGRLTPLGVAAAIVHPTWLTASPHRAIVYAVSEVGNDGKTEASVSSYAADPKSGALTLISKVGSGGGGATHLMLNAVYLPPAMLVANYGGGQVSVLPLGKNGALGPVSSVQIDVGSGPTPRQSSAHPHAVAIDPSGRFAFVADLGADRVFVYRFDPVTQKLSPADPAAVTLPAGSGPRHIVFHPGGRYAYVNGEFTGGISVLRWDAAARQMTLVKTVATRAPGFASELSAAELIVSPDGRFLYASNRGEDVIIVYAIDTKTGDLTEVQRNAGGKDPVALSIDPTRHWLLAANAGASQIVVFKLDAASGKLTPTDQAMPIEGPASIAFLTK